ncbi:MAG TPA: IS66 family transposase [Leucothrix mucor]|uniref:IS66 family transposase n=1 Tax=Leucothrix mucor TaxID=45248 RepID=A0A7V2WW65_LEUMU|nr:IS66 family transposase [Leucothrix mucor]
MLFEEKKVLEQKLNAILHELNQLKKLIFGSKSERFVPASSPPEQLELFSTQQSGSSSAKEEEKEIITYQRNKKKKHPGRTPLPDNIPTEDVIIEPEEDTTDMQLIGEEITETIDYTPGKLIKRRYIRKKYVRSTKQQEQGSSAVVIAPAPPRPLPKALAEAGLLAHLFISKYIDHLPFYRQIQIFKRQYGWTLHKSTINGWFAACCTLLKPLYDAHIRAVMQSDYLQADESHIKVQDSNKSARLNGGKGKTHQGYMWVYRNPLNGLVLFDYRKGRDMQSPKECLANFKGTLQCDGYNVYKSIANKQPDIHLVSCLAHIRRKFYDALNHHPDLAKYALKEIKKLYSIERQCREENLSVQHIAQRRKDKSAPIFNALLEWVETQHSTNLSKGPIGQALYYAKNELPLLSAYLEDGRIEIDNNLIENTIRPLALGRKNYLFAGSHQAAQRAAMMYSFFASCKTMDINPFYWLKDVLQTIGDTPVNQVAKLLPHNWGKKM